MGESQNYRQVKILTKSAKTWNFRRSIPYISNFQKIFKYHALSAYFLLVLRFLVKNFQNFISIEPYPNRFI